MSYPTSVIAVIHYIEAHIKDEKFDYNRLQEQVGFSRAHIRDMFHKNTGSSLAAYVKMRKIKTSAFELMHTDKTILEISYQYGFKNPETYTRTFRLVWNTKEEFITFIKKHIDEGYPCIALGIIGPPEPCIITGYRKNGEELLGWNFFQNDPEFGAGARLDESGYFVCDSWWENTDTQAVMCMGAINGDKINTQDIMTMAVKVMTGREEFGYSKGLSAYETWKKALSKESDFKVKDNYFVLFEKLLCQMDAMNCLVDGRKNAALYFRNLAGEDEEMAPAYEQIADAFDRCGDTAEQMWKLFGDPADMEAMLKRLADREVRQKACGLIDVAAKADTTALSFLKRI